MPTIHPTALIAPEAQVAADAVIGPYSIIGPKVIIGKGCEIMSHAVIDGRTTLGEDNKVYPFACIGLAPQDKKFGGEETELIIGSRNQMREYVTLHVGTKGGGGITRVGDDNLFMTHAHIAHDCQIGSHCVLANSATLAGHVQVEDHVIIGGLSAVHQFVRLGTQAIVGGKTGVARDVLPFTAVTGNRAFLEGLNLVGLRRKNMARETIQALQQAVEDLFDPAFAPTLNERLKRLEVEQGAEETVARLIAFARNSERGLVSFDKEGVAADGLAA